MSHDKAVQNCAIWMIGRPTDIEHSISNMNSEEFQDANTILIFNEEELISYLTEHIKTIIKTNKIQ